MNTTIAEEVAARLNQRRLEREIAERAEIERGVREARDREDKQVQMAAGRAEAAVSEWSAKTHAAIAVEFQGRRISIRMNHRDPVVRDVARNAAHLLTQYVNRLIGEGVVIANNTGRADAFTVDPMFVEKLLNLDLRYAHERGLVSVTDVKTGRPIKLKLDKLTLAPAPTRETSGVRDAWLSGGREPSAPRRSMRV